jgi:hypothetical protein
MMGWLKPNKKPDVPIVRPWAMLRADFPDDAVRDEKFEVLRPGDLNVAEVVKQLLEGMQCEVSDLIMDYDHGWIFTGQYQDWPFWCQITENGEETCLLCEDDSWKPFRRRPRPQHIDLLRRLHAELVRDGRFHDIVWYTVDDFDKEGKGAPEPVSE